MIFILLIINLYIKVIKLVYLLKVANIRQPDVVDFLLC